MQIYLFYKDDSKCIDEVKTLTNDKRIRTLCKILKMLNIFHINIEDFNERLRYQKLVYLLQVSGVPMGFRFNWYVRGPYSPGLADSLYIISKNQGLLEETAQINFRNQEIINQKIQKLTGVLAENIDNPEYLEIIGSLSYIRNNDPMLDKSEESLMKRLIELKPFIADIPNHKELMLDACSKINALKDSC